METFDTKQLIGMTESEAIGVITRANLQVRVRAPNDRASGEFLKDRVTLYVVNGKVSRAMIG